MKVGGLQCIITNDEYIIPINVINGLPYITMRRYTDEEWTTLPHVLLTVDRKWDPRILDNTIEDIDDWASMFKWYIQDPSDVVDEDDPNPNDMKENPFDESGY